MISILIPVNDYDIVALVHSMKNGIGKVQDFCEILIGDDGSSEEFRKLYRSLEGSGVRIVGMEKNVGRAVIRNKLVMEAKGDHILFIDSDTMVCGTAEAFLQKWIEHLPHARVICGGVLYHESPPGDPDKILRWKYGRRKDQLKANERNKNPHAHFTTFNVLIEKSIFSKIRFYEELKQYGHEDTLFGYQLKKAGIDILHIDNGLLHEGLETNRDFLTKTKLSIENLSKLYDIVTDLRTFSETATLLKYYNRLKILRLTRIFAGLFIRYRDRMERHLDSSDPSLKLLRFYKTSMLCTYREIHSRRKGLIPFFKTPENI
ncbi:MAG: glycosyltransferase [Bacteroidales bacterium]|jgi:GT2 family glycosyltransferase|nr:glycosyltransferase [Bacteroidales bacterium]